MMSRNWKSFKANNSTSYVRKTAEIRENPPKAEVVAAYKVSIQQALLRGDTAYAAKLQAKILGF